MAIERPVAKLGWLIDREFVFEKHNGPNRRAATRTLEGLHEAGLPDTGFESLCDGFEMLAEAVDADPTNSGLWSQYRAADLFLRGLAKDLAHGEKPEADWTTPATVTPIRPAAVRDPKKPGKANPRTGSGRGRQAAGEAADAVATPRRRGRS